MTEPPKTPDHPSLGIADRQMLADIKANVLQAPREELRVGRFRVLDRIGEGSMGVVFAAVDDKLQRRVALKLLHQGAVASAGERTARVLREAQALAQLTHPNIVQVHEVGEHEGQMFMAMELVEGQSLDQIQRESPSRSWKALLELYLEAGRGLAAAHAKGVIHRDFKPHNILVDADGRVRVVDFGLARGTIELDQQATTEFPMVEGAIERSKDGRLTATGAIAGTPAYMAPELFEGKPATKASDQFSFCVALYEAIYGRRPFEGARIHDVVSAARQGRILSPPADRPATRWLFKALSRGLAPEPSDRFPSMDAVLQELARDRGRGWRGGGLLGALVVVGSISWWAGTRTTPIPEEDSPDAAEDRAEVERRSRACETRAEQLRTRWQEARAHLNPSTIAAGDIDSLSTVLDAEFEQFLQRWRTSCLEEVNGDSCREIAETRLDDLLESPTTLTNEDVFYELTSGLDECLEAGISACGRAQPGSPANRALQSAWAAQARGDLDAAMGSATQAIEMATTQGERLTELRAKLQKGSIHKARGELAAARAELSDALPLAMDCEATVLAIDIALERAELEALHDGDLDHANTALDLAQRKLQENSSPLPLRQARLFEKSGGAKLYLEHRCTESLADYRKALELRKTAIEQREAQGFPTMLYERLAADAELNIANTKLYALLGYWGCATEDVDEDQVLEHYRSARRRFATAVGHEHHIGLAAYDFSLGAAYFNFDHPRDAIRSFESALAIYDAHHGPQSLPSGDAHHTLAAAHRSLGDLERAHYHAEKNVDVHRAHEGQPTSLGEAHDTFGVILHEQGKLEDARREFQLAIDALRPSAGREPSLKMLERRHITYGNLGLLEWDARTMAAAQEAVDQARAVKAELQERSPGVEHADQPQVVLVEARLMLAKGQKQLALEHLVGAEDLPDINPALLEAIKAERERATQ